MMLVWPERVDPAPHGKLGKGVLELSSASCGLLVAFVTPVLILIRAPSLQRSALQCSKLLAELAILFLESAQPLDHIFGLSGSRHKVCVRPQQHRVLLRHIFVDSAHPIGKAFILCAR